MKIGTLVLTFVVALAANALVIDNVFGFQILKPNLSSSSYHIR